MSAARVDLAQALPQYQLGEEIGRGGMGVVVAGFHPGLERTVAIKELPSSLAKDPATRARFAAEAKVLASLEHPHIVPIYDYVERDGLCLLVMENLPAGSVWSRFADQGFTPGSACAVALITCAALQYAHGRGVLHRDVKPENMLFSADGFLKVTDFGIAKVINGAQTLATGAGDILGTPAYMAPEQAEGKELGPPADVYATAVMLYELLTGKLPYSDEGGPLATVFRHVYEDPIPITQVAPDLPVPLVDVVMRGLARQPAERYADAETFGIAIGHAATAAWGAGWLDRAHIPMRTTGAIATSVEAAGTTGPSSSRDTVAVVRPDPAVAHAEGANPSDVDVDALVAVGDVLDRPPAPVLQALVAAVLLVATIVFALAGIGSTTPTDPLTPGQATIAGTDPATGPVPVDLSEDVKVVLTQPPAGAADVQLQFTAAEVNLPTSSTARLEPAEGGGAQASVAASASRYLVAGPVDATLDVLDTTGTTLTSNGFTAEPSTSGLLTVPGIVAIAVLLFVIAYAESFLRPLRRHGKRRVSAIVGLAVLGLVFGAALSVLTWAVAGADLTRVGIVTCAVTGLATGVMLALTAAQIGRRRRARRVYAAYQRRVASPKAA